MDVQDLLEPGRPDHAGVVLVGARGEQEGGVAEVGGVDLEGEVDRFVPGHVVEANAERIAGGRRAPVRTVTEAMELVPWLSCHPEGVPGRRAQVREGACLR